ncbi:MAG: sulfur carrier protein ThiS [Candidatus Eremiobacteraeota bacterium]|nr:sulfur carrier protein ThiS [Candidatus Eremiobacteraeota bacterium]
MRATINGRVQEFQKALSVTELLDVLGAPQSGIAVARNDKVIPKSRLSLELIDDGDSVEIIRAVAGG